MKRERMPSRHRRLRRVVVLMPDELVRRIDAFSDEYGKDIYDYRNRGATIRAMVELGLNVEDDITEE